MFNLFFISWIIFFNGAFFIITYLFNNMNSTFSKTKWSNEIEIDAVNEFTQNATAICTKWLQKWTVVPYVCRRYQLCDVTQECIPIAVLPCRAVLINNRAVLYSLIFTPIAAVLQANTEPIRNGPVETKNRAVKMRKGIVTLLVPVQILSKWNAVRSAVKHEIMTSFNIPI